CAVCLPIKEGHCVPYGQAPTKLLNFYPTDEESKCRAFIHTTFELSQDRKKLQMFGDNKAWSGKNSDGRNNKLITELKGLIATVCHDRSVPAKTTLEAFQDLIELGQRGAGGDVCLKIQQEIIETIKSEPFAPVVSKGPGVCPGELRLWNHKFADCFNFKNSADLEGIDTLATKELNAKKKVLRKYGCYEFDTEDVLSCLSVMGDPPLKNSTRPEREQIFKTVSAYLLDGYWDLDEFFRIEMFVDESGKIFNLENGRFIESRKIVLPGCFEFNTLSQESFNHLEKYLFRDDLEDASEEIKKFIVGSQYEFANNNLLGYLLDLDEDEENHWWQKNGEEILA
ncbi:uncharacterized protein METZ01_LOCUS329621, partial [marine metagenome]